MATALLLALAWLVVILPMPKGVFWQSDTFWLIEIGRNILQHHRLPTVDIYSANSLNSPWMVYQWLSEVIFALAHNGLALKGVEIVVVVTLTYLLSVLMFRYMITEGCNPIASFVTTVIVFHATHPEISSARPQLFSYVCLFLLYGILDKAWKSPPDRQSLGSAVLKTAAIAIVWTNCHVSFPLGACVAGLYASSAAASALLSKQQNAGRLLTFGLITIVFILASMVNPYGIELWKFALHVSAVTPAHGAAAYEWRPLDWSALGVYAAVYCLMLLSALAAWKRITTPALLLVVGLFAAGCLHARLMIYFCIVAAPAVGQALTMAFSRHADAPTERIKAAIVEAATSRLYPVAILVLAILVAWLSPLYPGFALPPVQAAEFLRVNPPAGNLFCSAHAGSYLIYRFRSSIKVFVDPRVDLYDPAFMDTYLKVIQGRDWEETFAKYRIAEALVPNDSPLKDLVALSPRWKSLYRDDAFSIFVKTDKSP
ncbi:MAG TPA: hypothetical protein V6D22_20410 [Candidatus Obscuribacterales bacterium]